MGVEPVQVSFLRFLRFLLAVLLAAAAAFAAGASPAAAAEGCGSGGGVTGVVTIDSPVPNAVVSGRFRVRGTASSGLPVGGINRVEVNLGGVSASADYDPGNAVDFDLPVDASNVAPGDRTLTVVACGGNSLTGALSRGERSIPVKVEAAPVTTTVRTSTTAAASASAIGAGAGAPSTTTTAVGGAAAAAVAAGGTSTTVTTTARPTTTQAEARAPAAARPDPVRPRAGPDAPLVLTESPDRGSSGPPLWVGAVVGISGGLGLLFSAATWRRRAHGPVPAEPVDPDLVDVR